MSTGKSEWRNAGIGAALQLFEVSTLGQPFDNMKTIMAANRTDNLRTAVRRIHAKGGLPAFWRGLIPWAWIEASTKGGVVLFTSSEVSKHAQTLGMSPELASATGGVVGGFCQAYTTMGFCTFMKTVEVTRDKTGKQGGESSLSIARGVLRTEGIRGMYKGVNAVALRQATNWGSRFGFSRIIESALRRGDTERRLGKGERLLASAVGGGMACWNHPFEVLRVEMQVPRSDSGAKRLSLTEAARRVFAENGVRGFYRGVTPRVLLSGYLTVVMVFGGDEVKAYLNK